jgi:hypothetical protein
VPASIGSVGAGAGAGVGGGAFGGFGGGVGGTFFFPENMSAAVLEVWI